MTRIAALLSVPAGLFVLLGAILLLPSKLEYAELSFRDRQIFDANDLLTEVNDIKPDNVEAQFRLAKLHVHLGKVDEAMEALHRLIEHGAGDPLLKLTLAELAQSKGQMDLAMDLHLDLPVNRLSPQQRTELAGWLRYNGRHNKEIQYLELLNAEDIATPKHTTRLADLLIAKERKGEAIELLSSLDDDQQLHDDRAKLVLLALLLGEGLQNNAELRVRRWLSQVPGRSFHMNVKRIFAARGVKIAEVEVPKIAPGD